MNGFKLDVRKGGLDEERSLDSLVMEKLFQCTHAVQHVVRWRRHEYGITRASAADPILRAAEFARPLFAAPPFGEEDAVNFLKQPERHWQLTQPLQTVIHSGNIVG